MNVKQIFCLFFLLEVANCCPSTPDCENYQRLNPNTDKCEEPAPTSSKPSVWLDSCSATQSDCENYGLDFDLTHSWGGDLNCFNGGQAVRCVVKDKPATSTTSANRFKFLAYNVFERFHFITVDGQRERTCRVAKWILEDIPDIDAIAFQEVFIGGCFEDDLDMNKIFSYYGFSETTEVVDDIFRLNGGIYIVSKHPIVKQGSHVFWNTDWLSPDNFVAKGVSYAKVAKTVNGVTEFYHLFSSHLQNGGGSDNSIRYAQCGEWANYVSSLNIPSNEAIIYGADLNLLPHEYPACLNQMSGEMPNYVPNMVQNTTWDSTTNTILAINNGHRTPNLIDYVFFNKYHKLPISSSQEIFDAKTNQFSVCYAEEEVDISRQKHTPAYSCNKVIEQISDISDHYPVLGDFTF